MDKSPDKSIIVNMTEPVSRQQIQQALTAEHFQQYRTWVKKLAAELNIAMVDCAAALASLHPQTHLEPVVPAIEEEQSRFDLAHKKLRYRVEVGRKHAITDELLKQVLVEEAGVEKKMIGQIDIRYVFSLIELPEGMPEDIFQHLKNVEINQQKLHIKRVKNKNPKRHKGGYRRARNGRNKKNTEAAQTVNSGNSAK